jgi:hypothetical protein
MWTLLVYLNDITSVQNINVTTLQDINITNLPNINITVLQNIKISTLQNKSEIYIPTLQEHRTSMTQTAWRHQTIA